MRTPLSVATMRELAERVGRQENVPAPLLLAIARHESGGFYPDAHRAEPHLQDASHGLMQILMSTAQGYGYRGTADGLYDPLTNMTYGAKHLKNLLHRTKDLQTAISAYNAGIGNAKRATVPTRFCLEWKPSAPTSGRSIDRDCKVIRNVPVGEFYNQPYVNVILRHLTTYGGSAGMPLTYQPMTGSGSGGGPAAGSPGGPLPSPSPNVPANGSPTFVLRTVPVVILAAVGAIWYLVRGGVKW